ncbi:MAG TPA: MarR family transcriptional regulator [Rickettsiales bacterium]|nr:MarR family transcriptional regulator [Rickettsiales bacterium]
MPVNKTTVTQKPDYEKRIVRALRQLTQKLDAHSRQLLANHDVTMPQIICLDTLTDKGAMTVSSLASTIHLTPSTTVGIIDRLEKKGFVKRMRDSTDRRAVFVEVTNEGREFMISSPHLLHNRLRDNLNRLLERDQAQIANSLDVLVQLMDKKP